VTAAAVRQGVVAPALPRAEAAVQLRSVAQALHAEAVVALLRRAVAAEMELPRRAQAVVVELPRGGLAAREPLSKFVGGQRISCFVIADVTQREASHMCR
jgi:hypothetical protein